MRASGATRVPRTSTTRPSTLTQPLAIQASASRREQSPSSLIRFESLGCSIGPACLARSGPVYPSRPGAPGPRAAHRGGLMELAYISHPSSRDHEMGAMHPECPERSTVIADRLLLRGTIDFVSAMDAPPASDEQILRAHTARHLAELRAMVPSSGLRQIDPD